MLDKYSIYLVVKNIILNIIITTIRKFMFNLSSGLLPIHQKEGNPYFFQ